MNLNKKFFVSTLAAAVLATGVFMTGQANAGMHHRNGGMQQNSAYQTLPAEKQKQYDAIMKDFADKTSSLRDKIAAKQIELKTLGTSSNPDPKAVGKASEELVALQNDFAREHQALSDRITKEVGDNVSSDYGNRGRGYHGGYHRGYNGGSNGGYNGNCPMNNCNY